jgi:drug/metabolite transporter (DMT)-like permease
LEQFDLVANGGPPIAIGLERDRKISTTTGKGRRPEIAEVDRNRGPVGRSELTTAALSVGELDSNRGRRLACRLVKPSRAAFEEHSAFPPPESSAHRPRLLLPALALNVLIASGTFLVAKRTLAEFPPLVLALLRFVLAAGVLWPLVRGLRGTPTIERRDRKRLVLLGMLAVPLNQGLFLYGMQWASASHAALLYALTPTFVVSLGVWSGNSPPTRSQLLGIALAFLGVLTLLVQRGLHFDSRSVAGDLCVFVAVIMWALYLILGRNVTRRYGPLVVTAEALLAGTLIYLPIGLVALRGFDPTHISLGGWMGLFYLAWLTSAVNYVIWFWGLEFLAPVSVALLTNLQPVVTAALAWLLLREVLPAGFALSSALVLGGVWLTQAAARRVEGCALGSGARERRGAPQ